MNIKLIAIDMDDTLLTDEKKISLENATAIKEAIDHGIIVTIATGRMYESALPYAKQLNMNVPLIVYNGALIKNSTTGEIIYEHTMDMDVTYEVLQYCRHHNIHVQGYWDNKVYTDIIDDNSRWYSKIINQPINEIGDDLFDIKHKTYKLLLMLQPGKMKDCWRELEEKFSSKIEITSSIPNFLEIITPGVNKWEAVKNLAQKKGFKSDEIMCIGDNHNDICMLKNTGLSVAVNNANEEVKSYAKWIVADNNHNGVAEAIKKVLI